MDSTIIGKIFANLCRKQAFFSSRAMRRDFLNKYDQLAKVPKMVSIYRTLLQDSSAAQYNSEALVDERVAKAILRMDDPEILGE